MYEKSLLSRRSIVCAPIAFGASISVCGSAFANQARAVSWRTGSADDFLPLVGQAFIAKMQDGNLLHLTLVDAEAGRSGPARPKNLPRSESVLLTFESDASEDLAAQGDHTVSIFSDTLGKFEAFLGATPRRSGGYDIELVLN